jgi:carbon-monoxide dehydrogenase medium subunit
LYETRYHRPATLAEALTLFAGAREGRYLSGGQTLIPTMKQRLAAPSDVIDIAGLDELRGIAVAGDMLLIGAASTHAEVNRSATVAEAIPALAALAGMVGDPAVRARGTLGGSLANNDPAADYPAAALALDATVRTDKRTIAASDFFTGLFSTALEDGEVVTRIDFPVPKRAAYEKFRNPASRYAMAGAFVAVMPDGAVRVAITGAGAEGVFRAGEIEALLTGSWDPAAIDAVAIDESAMLSDIHGSARYRANLVRVMAKRAAIAAGA